MNELYKSIIVVDLQGCQQQSLSDAVQLPKTRMLAIDNENILEDLSDFLCQVM